MTQRENFFSSNNYAGKYTLKYEIPNTTHWDKNQVMYSWSNSAIYHKVGIIFGMFVKYSLLSYRVVMRLT